MRLHVPAPPVALFEPRIVPVIAPPPVTERRYSLEPLQEQLRELDSIPRCRYSLKKLQEQLRELDSIRGDKNASVAEEAHVHVLRQITELTQQR